MDFSITSTKEGTIILTLIPMTDKQERCNGVVQLNVIKGQTHEYPKKSKSTTLTDQLQINNEIKTFIDEVSKNDVSEGTIHEPRAHFFGNLRRKASKTSETTL